MFCLGYALWSGRSVDAERGGNPFGGTSTKPHLGMRWGTPVTEHGLAEIGPPNPPLRGDESRESLPRSGVDHHSLDRIVQCDR